MAYRDDRVAMLARADALEQALDEAEAKRAQVEAERDALAAEAALLRAALVRAVGARTFRARAAPPRARPELAAVLLLTAGFVLAAISTGGRSGPANAVLQRGAAHASDGSEALVDAESRAAPAAWIHLDGVDGRGLADVPDTPDGRGAIDDAAPRLCRPGDALP